jgi:hypothetical protein
LRHSHCPARAGDDLPAPARGVAGEELVDPLGAAGSARKRSRRRQDNPMLGDLRTHHGLISDAITAARKKTNAGHDSMRWAATTRSTSNAYAICAFPLSLGR